MEGISEELMKEIVSREIVSKVEAAKELLSISLQTINSVNAADISEEEIDEAVLSAISAIRALQSVNCCLQVVDLIQR